jgi:hypothetical protein
MPWGASDGTAAEGAEAGMVGSITGAGFLRMMVFTHDARFLALGFFATKIQKTTNTTITPRLPTAHHTIRVVDPV